MPGNATTLELYALKRVSLLAWNCHQQPVLRIQSLYSCPTVILASTKNTPLVCGCRQPCPRYIPGELSLQLQETHRNLDALHQEFTSVRLNETTLDSRMKSSRGKRFWMDEFVHEDGRKMSGMYVLLKGNDIEDGGSTLMEGMEEEDYRKMRVSELKQEIVKHGFGEQLLQLKNLLKKGLLALYEKHVLIKLFIFKKEKEMEEFVVVKL